MSLENIKGNIKSILENNDYILLVILMILFISLISPTSTRMGFESLGEVLPEFLSNYFKNLSLTNNQVISIYPLLSTFLSLSLFMHLLSYRTDNYYLESHRLLHFFLHINTYFILFFLILVRLDMTQFISPVEFFQQTNWLMIYFCIISFALSFIYLSSILIGLIKK
ncbi:hypothetical protein [Oceanobacillus sp. FSL W7-1293]|uniref:hypothetical protein n=1 Tax=Oceanobacillus sp. FSL W7-1293 TaxID=2921699 RepID=UPI0030D546DB